STSSRTQFTTEGFSNWKNSSDRLIEHETSKNHLNSFIAFGLRSEMLGRIDTELQKQVEQEKSYWKTILTRLISVIKFLCKRGLALRGDDELVGSKSNGNYLGLLELLAEYDDFLKKHIQEKGNCGSGHTNYLSSNICEQLIQCMGHQVLNAIVTRIKISKYYSISLDSTPDEGHVDQLTVVFRFMEGSKPVERFLKFLPNQGHKAQDMFNSIMKVLENNGIEINNCRGQSYDNASAMSGKYNGLQSKINAVNKLATWVPCAAHSLNLVGKVAAECCSSAISFFNFLEAIYTFFTASTHRYDELKKNLQSTDKTVRIQIPKRISTTRWSCRSDATKALFHGYSQIKSTLDSISNNLNELPKTRDEANGLYNKMCKLETGIYCAFWNEILDRFNATNKILQAPTLDLNNAVASVKSLKCFIDAQRNGFSMFEKKGKIISKSNEYNDNKKRSRKLNIRLNPLDYGKGPDSQLNHSEKFKVECFLPVIDQMSSAISQRLKAYEVICDRFGFFGQLNNLSNEELQEAAKKLVAVYDDDLDELLCVEIIHFSQFIKLYSKPAEMSNEHFMYKTLIEKDVISAFPNVEIALRMYL
ncbi:zinc finger MYM-type protein 1-like, partial [Aphis craccivora]